MELKKITPIKGQVYEILRPTETKKIEDLIYQHIYYKDDITNEIFDTTIKLEDKYYGLKYEKTIKLKSHNLGEANIQTVLYLVKIYDGYLQEMVYKLDDDRKHFEDISIIADFYLDKIEVLYDKPYYKDKDDIYNTHRSWLLEKPKSYFVTLPNNTNKYISLLFKEYTNIETITDWY
jgi:hypothetical protein